MAPSFFTRQHIKACNDDWYVYHEPINLSLTSDVFFSTYEYLQKRTLVGNKNNDEDNFYFIDSTSK